MLAAYCSGIVFQDRLKWMLWAVLFSYVILGYGIWRNKHAVRRAENCRELQRQYRIAAVCRCRKRVRFIGKKKGVVQPLMQRETYFLMILPLIFLTGAFLGKLHATDYPIDAVLERKTEATAEGRICSITETKSGYRLELNHISIVLHDSVYEENEETENKIESGWQINSGRNPSEDKRRDADRLMRGERYTKGKLLVYCESAEGLKIGNRIRLKGKAVPFAKPENAGQFDERAYYRAERMCCKFSADEIAILNDSVDEIREWCRRIRNRLDAIYEEILPEKHAGIVSAILLGDKAELDADIKALYQKNGIAHILAISGLHVSLLGMGLFALIRKCGSPLIPAAAATMLILVFYGCITEFSVSTQRAVGMLVIAMFARILGRSYESRSACALCGLLILIANPMQLYQAGFQLSFGAAFGISYFGRELEQMKLNKGKTVAEKLKVSFVSGLTTQLITAPIILNCFYEIPLYSIFLNLPVIGLLSSMVFLSILAGFTGMFSYSLGKFFAGTVYVILEFYELLCRLMEKLPCPIWLYGKPQGWRMAAYFCVLWSFFVVAKKIGEHYRHHPKQARYRRWAFLVLCLLPLVFVKGKGQSTGEGTVNFLSVGQGDCSVVRSSNGNAYLIDCGSSSVKEVGEYRLKPWLKYHGISRLETVFLSHPDSDHTNGVMELLEGTNAPGDWYRGEIQIVNLVLPAAFREDTEAVVAKAWKSTESQEDRQSEQKGFAAIYKRACEVGIPVHWFDTGDKVMEEGVSFTCLHPYQDYPTYETNDASMVLMLEGRDTTVLFTGDIGANGEEHVMRELKLRLTSKEKTEEKERGNEQTNKRTAILKVAHHGSKHSTSMEFLELLQPDVSIISCGRDNLFGHPHDETLQRLRQIGSRVTSTMDKGTITMHIVQHK